MEGTPDSERRLSLKAESRQKGKKNFSPCKCQELNSAKIKQDWKRTLSSADDNAAQLAFSFLDL